ncbi:MAG: DUF192 domain-containing protein [Phycisphaerae bacterium]
MFRYRSVVAAFGLCMIGFHVAGCIGSSEDAARNAARGSAAQRKFPLDTLKTSSISINGQAIRVWLATTPDTREEGLMHVPENEIADDQGMLFVFPNEQQLSFWMRNTITSLDIAFARGDGTIVATWTMPPLTLQNFPSGEPSQFALEMKAGAFQRLNVKTGDRMIIPAEASKVSP